MIDGAGADIGWLMRERRTVIQKSEKITTEKLQSAHFRPFEELREIFLSLINASRNLNMLIFDLITRVRKRLSGSS
jgi:hypothetical protein